jgi:hypothetical protein
VSHLSFPLAVEVVCHDVDHVQVLGDFRYIISIRKILVNATLKMIIKREAPKISRVCNRKFSRATPVAYSAFNTYPAAMASKLAGTAAVSSSLGCPELFASPSNASRNSFSRLT